jgi:hypothetical protein
MNGKLVVPQYPEEEKEFYMAIGKAITQWQEVEGKLAMIFSASMSGNQRTEKMHNAYANAAFHTVLNFETKLGMTNSAIEMAHFSLGYTDLKMLEAWHPLFNRASRRAKRRNELAHFQMHYDWNRKPGRRYYLRPNTMDMRAWMKFAGHPPERDTCLIRATGQSFEKLGLDLTAFFLKWYTF